MMRHSDWAGLPKPSDTRRLEQWHLSGRPRADGPRQPAAARSCSHVTQRKSITSPGSAATGPTARAQKTGHTSFSTTPEASTA